MDEAPLLGGGSQDDDDQGPITAPTFVSADEWNANLDSGMLVRDKANQEHSESQSHDINRVFWGRMFRLVKLGWDTQATILFLIINVLLLISAFINNEFLTAIGSEITTMTLGYMDTMEQIDAPIPAFNNATLCECYVGMAGVDACADFREIVKTNIWGNGPYDCFGGYPACNNSASEATCILSDFTVPCLPPIITTEVATRPTSTKMSLV